MAKSSQATLVRSIGDMLENLPGLLDCETCPQELFGLFQLRKRDVRIAAHDHGPRLDDHSGVPCREGT